MNFAQLNIGTQNEPALTNGNTVLQTITGAPFIWPWNRNKASFLASVGVQDYVQTITDFGYMEAASCQPAASITAVSLTGNVATYTAVNSFVVGDLVTVTGTATFGGIFNVTRAAITVATSTTFSVALTNANVALVADTGQAVSGHAFPLEIKAEALTEAAEQGRPNWISTQVNGSTLSFRLVGVPEQTYLIVVTYQKQPTMFTALPNTWPIPDKVQYIYNFGFLFLTLDFFDDPRAARYRQLFIATLLGAQSGLSEQDRNLFLGNFLPRTREEQSTVRGEDQGVAARGV